MKKTRTPFLIIILLLLIIVEASIILILTTSKGSTPKQEIIIRNESICEKHPSCPVVRSPEKIDDGIVFSLELGEKTELIVPCGGDEETYKASLKHGTPIVFKSIQEAGDGTASSPKRVTSAVVSFDGFEQTISPTTTAIYLHDSRYPNDPKKLFLEGMYLEVLHLDTVIQLKGVRRAC